MKRFSSFCLLLGLCLRFGAASAQTQPTTYTVGNTTLTASTLVTGLDTPWELLWGPDNQLWMTERLGRVSRVNPTTGQVTPLLTIADVTETGESGLLGMVVAPQTGSAQLSVFVVYTYTTGGQLREKLVRYQYTPGGTTLTNPQIILDNIPAQGTHNGSRLLLLPDNTLLMTTGDAQNTSASQERQSLSGKILRLNLDGSVPANNPTPGSLVYTLGHRNPQGLTRVPSTGRIYSSEHGPSNDDELNLIEANRNYGWPNVEGFCNQPAEQTFCQANTVREPLVAWTPTRGLSGLTYYNHPAVPEWQNTLLLLSLRAGAFTYLPLSAAGDQVTRQTDLWTGTYGRMRAICVSPQGRVYIGTSNRDTYGSPGPNDDRIVVLENRAYVTTSTKASASLEFGAFPNPAKDQLRIRFAQALKQSATLKVFNTLGQQLHQDAVAAGQAGAELTTARWQPGTYLLVLQAADGGTRTQRFQVTR